MIIAWWNKHSPIVINIIDEELIHWKTARWVEWRPARAEEIAMYEKGITIYSLKNGRK